MEDQPKTAETGAPAPSGTFPKVGKAPKAKSGKSKPQAKPKHPKYKEMVMTALTDIKKRDGVSRQAISKYITTKYPLGSSSNRHLGLALNSLVAGDNITRTKGVGLAGYFKVNKEAASLVKQAASRTKKRKTSAKKRKPLKKRGATKRKSPVKRRKAAKSVKRRVVKKNTKRGVKKSAKRGRPKKR